MWLTAAPSSRHVGVSGTGVRLDVNALSLTTAAVDLLYAQYAVVEWLEIYDSSPTTTKTTYGIRGQFIRKDILEVNSF